ncbi:class I SAM-dependent methyltransferase [bacterium]|nr:class I SAM-dependent methyltransferase [bacterium]MBU1675310.1 class I SAM-dependent methyltransferase [bacterium]
MSDDIKRKEAEYFDEYTETLVRAPLWKYYAISRRSKNDYRRAEISRCPGARVLDYGCGAGHHSLELADAGAARVVGIDISPRSIEVAREAAARAGAENTEFHAMDAEKMDFPDDSFDLVTGLAILHHLDLDVAGRELARVLKPGGVAVFSEPLGHNPALNLFRRVTPRMRTADEHPLVRADVKVLERHFDGVEVRCFHMCSLLAIPLVKWPRVFEPFLRVMDGLDDVLFKMIPPLRWWGWYATLEFTRPVKS